MGKPRKEKYVWSDEKEDKLIQFYKDNTFLYDAEAAGYSVGTKRQVAYEEIGRQLDIKVEEIDGHLKSLRTQFRRVLNDVREKTKSGSGAVELSKCNTFLWNALRFLENHVKPSRSTVTSKLKKKTQKKKYSTRSGANQGDDDEEVDDQPGPSQASETLEEDDKDNTTTHHDSSKDETTSGIGGNDGAGGAVSGDGDLDNVPTPANDTSEAETNRPEDVEGPLDLSVSSSVCTPIKNKTEADKVSDEKQPQRLSDGSTSVVTTTDISEPQAGTSGESAKITEIAPSDVNVIIEDLKDIGADGEEIQMMQAILKSPTPPPKKSCEESCDPTTSQQGNTLSDKGAADACERLHSFMNMAKEDDQKLSAEEKHNKDFVDTSNVIVKSNVHVLKTSTKPEDLQNPPIVQRRTSRESSKDRSRSQSREVSLERDKTSNASRSRSSSINTESVTIKPWPKKDISGGKKTSAALKKNESRSKSATLMKDIATKSDRRLELMEEMTETYRDNVIMKYKYEADKSARDERRERNLELARLKEPEEDEESLWAKLMDKKIRSVPDVKIRTALMEHCIHLTNKAMRGKWKPDDEEEEDDIPVPKRQRRMEMHPTHQEMMGMRAIPQFYPPPPHHMNMPPPGHQIPFAAGSNQDQNAMFQQHMHFNVQQGFGQNVAPSATNFNQTNIQEQTTGCSASSNTMGSTDSAQGNAQQSFANL